MSQRSHRRITTTIVALFVSLFLALVSSPTNAHADPLHVSISGEGGPAGSTVLTIEGCNTPQVSGLVLTFTENDTVVDTVTADRSTTQVTWTPPDHGIYLVTLDCLSYSGDESYAWGQTMIYHQLYIVLDDLRDQCPGTTLTLKAKGLPAGLTLDATWSEMTEGDALATQRRVAVTDANGGITATVTVPKYGNGGGTISLTLGTSDDVYAFFWYVDIAPAGNCSSGGNPQPGKDGRPGLPDTGA